MYMQVYFHPVSRGMETVLTNLFARAKYCYQQQRDQMKTQADLLEPFLARQWMVSDYLQLDDHVISALFTQWTQDNDPILADLASRFLSRRPFKSMIVTDDDRMELTTAIHNELRAHGYDVDYYFGESSSFDLPYDYYRPHEPASGKIQIDLLTKTGQEVELSQVSPLVRSITGRERGDQRLFFPRELLSALYQIPAADRNSDQVMIILAHKQESNDVTHHLQGRLF